MIGHGLTAIVEESMVFNFHISVSSAAEGETIRYRAFRSAGGKRPPDRRVTNVAFGHSYTYYMLYFEFMTVVCPLTHFAFQPGISN